MTDLAAPRQFTCLTARGTVYDHGAQVVDWTPIGSGPVLWLSERTALSADTAIRGGVPICWPWFALGPTGDRRPMHGVARTRTWDFLGAQEAEESVECRYRLEADDAVPAGVDVFFTARFGRSLRLALEVVNRSETTFAYEEALHAYLAVGDVREVVVEGLDGCDYLDKVASGGPAMRRQHGDIRIEGETDRIYRTSDPVVVTDSVLGRRLRIARSCAAHVVVWNPWMEKAREVVDMPDDGWRSMLCVEGANIGDAAVRLEPGDSHTMGYEIVVSPIT